MRALIEARERHPSWGAKKLLVLLSGRHPDGAWPARSTVCDILNRHGLIRKPRARRRVGHPGKPGTAMSAPNLVWCADFKGQFKTTRNLRDRLALLEMPPPDLLPTPTTFLLPTYPQPCNLST